MNRKKWQFWLIAAVLVLTVYNILPTVFFYSKPLNAPIELKQAEKIAGSIMQRINQLETDSVEWIHSYTKMIGVTPEQVKTIRKTPQIIEVKFPTKSQSERFEHLLPRAGSLIPFYPSQLSLGQYETSIDQYVDSHGSENITYVQRRIPVQFDPNNYTKYFSYGKMFRTDGTATNEYWSLLTDRLMQIALVIGGPSENAGLVDLTIKLQGDSRSSDYSYILAQNILRIERSFSNQPTIRDRLFGSFTQGYFSNRTAVIRQLTDSMNQTKDQIQSEKITLKEQPGSEIHQLEIKALEGKETTLLKAISLLKSHKTAFASGHDPWDESDVLTLIQESLKDTSNQHQDFSLQNRNPLLKSVSLDLENRTMSLNLQNDVQTIRDHLNESTKLDGINQFIYDEIARVSRESSETAVPQGDSFVIKISDLVKSKSFLQLDLSSIARSKFVNTQHLLNEGWDRTSADFSQSAYPVTQWGKFKALPKEQQHLQLVLYAPSLSEEPPAQGFRTNSIYVIAKDFSKIASKFKGGNSIEAERASTDFENLVQLLKNHGFVGYPGTTYPLSNDYANDYIFEISDFYLPVLQASRENFTVHGTKRFAVLELSDTKDRILVQNRIETEMQEDLLKWRDEYQTAQVDPTLQSQFDVPPPTKNVFVNNLKLSCRKYFRGDERKILKWGQDLSGGKTVQLALKDSNGKNVTNEADLRQGINELYNRVNKMGVSDVSIRQEGKNITLDFPGSQDISASQLVKASSMTFNIANEQFRTDGGALSSDVNRYLQEVWNEAVVTNKKDIENINLIAWQHLYGDSLTGETATPRSDAARALYENGLRLANPSDPQISSEFNDTTSKVGMYRGANFTDWHNQTHPLTVLFKNFALEGSNLDNVRGSYDPTKGNFLSFEIKTSQTLSSGQKTSPRKDLYSWSSVFAKETITGSQYETYTKGSGWRMAVVLNGYIVSMPHLEAPLKDSGTITGHFTQREINQLTADLKAGSLSFTPQILSEKSVSPEIGTKERHQAIVATIIALLSVILLMVAYYRFAGVIASVAVVLNLLIIWATLQNIGASITLAELAGIILTVGMAVDANVLVFERIREEFTRTGKLASSVSSGYRKAFSAIVDSNITTIIAALILLHFDSGPIKGFAVSLIIGICSSMFTALFMTRYFFSKWIQNPNRKQLRMANLIRPMGWNFLKHGRISIVITAALVLAGGIALSKDRNTIFGMDFTGGYAMNIELNTSNVENYRTRVESALVAAGANAQDIHIRELLPANHLRIFFSTSMNQQGRPFFGLPMESSVDNPEYPYMTNPRIEWVVGALEAADITIGEKSLIELDQNWKSISGQMSDAMRNNAIIGLVLALICILIYITFRFEFKYAISATIGLGVDVLVTIALLALLHLLKVPVQIDLNTVAALMTIVGYSLNDTIIVFDRIREDVKVMKRESFAEVINHALNATLSRTVLTSGTTLLVLLSLVIFGGPSIFGFSLIMSIGVIVGTLSTFFISTTLLSYFQKKHKKNDASALLNGAS